MAIGLLTGGATANDASASTGEDVVDTINALLSRGSDVVSVTEYGAPGIGDDETDDTAAINAALLAGAGGIVVFPKAAGSYRVTTLNIPANTTLLGTGRIDVYNPSNLTDFDGGSTIRALDAASGVLNPQGVGITIAGLSFVGGFTKTANIFTDASDPLRMTFINCGFYHFKYGIGHNTKPIRVSKVFDCHLSNNGVGLRNFVDSAVTNCEINANTDGVSQLSGANDTAYFGNKVEWNSKSNWVFSGSNSCTITGGVCDRSGDNGFDIRNSKLTIAAVICRRNGSLGGKAHFYLEANSSFIATGIETETGGDDGGGGTVSPAYAVIGGGAATGYNSFSNCDLSGFVSAAESGVVSRVFYDTCRGVSSRKDADFSFSGTVTAGGAQTVTVSGKSALTPALSTFTLNSRKIRIGVATRNATSGTTSSQEFVVAINRGGSGNASASFIFRQNTASTLINDTGAALNVTITNIAADGTSFDVVATNTIGSDIQASISVNKYDQP